MQKLLAIDHDLLSAAELVAARRRTSVEKVVSLFLKSYVAPVEVGERSRAGVLLIPVQPGAQTVTLEHVNELRDDLL